MSVRPTTAAAAKGNGPKAPPPAGSRTRGRALLRLALEHSATALSLGVFVVVSSLLIIINKAVLVDDGFRFPFALTSMGQIVSALAAVPFAATGLVKVKPPPTWDEFRNKLLPTAVCSATTMFTGNYAYLYLSVAFIQILKAFTPAMTLGLLVLMGIERWSAVVAVSVLMIAVGTAGSVLVESSTPAFHLLAFLSFMISSATEAGRVVLFQVSMGTLHYNVWESLIYLSPITGAILLALSVLLEWGPMVEPGGGLSKMWANPGLYLAAMSMSFLVNMTTYIAIRQSSSLTFKVVGCVKNAVVVMAGVAFMGEHVTIGQGVGYSVSIAGFLIYSMAKVYQQQAQQPKAGADTVSKQD